MPEYNVGDQIIVKAPSMDWFEGSVPVDLTDNFEFTATVRYIRSGLEVGLMYKNTKGEKEDGCWCYKKRVVGHAVKDKTYLANKLIQMHGDRA